MLIFKYSFYLIKIRSTPDTIKWHTGCGTLSYPMGTGGSFPGGKARPDQKTCKTDRANTAEHHLLC
jgi:hypothetical protein